MADFFLSNLKSTLDNCITELDEIHSMFCRNPESDFTRNRKLSFREYIQFMLQMQSKSVSNEILDFFEHSLSAPSKSAFPPMICQMGFTDTLWTNECKIFVSISDILEGRSNPKIDTLKKIAECLEISMAELLCEPEEIDMVRVKRADCQEMCDRICSYDEVTRNRVLGYMDCLSDNNKYL